MSIAFKQISRRCVTALLLTGTIACFGQAQQYEAVRAELRAEQLRHSKVEQKLADETTDAMAERSIALNHCSGSECSVSEKQFQEKRKQIQDDTIREQATHNKNVNAINHKADAYCTRPDCANSSPGKSPCSGGSCGGN